MSSLKCFILYKAYYLCDMLYPERFESCQPYFNRYYDECGYPNSNMNKTVPTGACPATNHLSTPRTAQSSPHTTTKNTHTAKVTSTKPSLNLFEDNIYL